MATGNVRRNDADVWRYHARTEACGRMLVSALGSLRLALLVGATAEIWAFCLFQKVGENCGAHKIADSTVIRTEL